jgi:hypothetical protein
VTGGRYRIVLRGRLDERYESAFDGMVLEPGHGQTVLIGRSVTRRTHTGCSTGCATSASTL